MDDEMTFTTLMTPEHLAGVMEGVPRPLGSLKLDHATLLTRLETLMPFIRSFSLRTAQLLEQRKGDEACQELAGSVNRLARVLDISLQDGFVLSMCLLVTAIIVRNTQPLIESLAKKGASTWAGWLRKP
jgi:hypothetical protein